MGDIHGDIQRYNSIMTKINLKSEDKLYVLGDVIDDMPYGIEILLELMQMKNVTVLLGNHEYMMLNAINNPHNSSLLHKWLQNEGILTLENFLHQNKATQEKNKSMSGYIHFTNRKTKHARLTLLIYYTTKVNR